MSHYEEAELQELRKLMKESQDLQEEDRKHPPYTLDTVQKEGRSRKLNYLEEKVRYHLDRLEKKITEAGSRDKGQTVQGKPDSDTSKGNGATSTPLSRANGDQVSQTGAKPEILNHGQGNESSLLEEKSERWMKDYQKGLQLVEEAKGTQKVSEELLQKLEQGATGG